MDQPKQQNRFMAWLRAHRIWVIVAAGLVLVVGASITVYALLYQKPVEITATPIAKKAVVPPVVVPKFYSPLTGNLVADQPATTAAVTGIMIENSPDARPQSGLKDAGVVFEAIAEGGITRFLALYQESKPQLIGPVRSVRMYYVDWVAAFNASVAHIGGSAGALAEVRNGNYRDIDQFFNSGAYYRATDRYAPHNVYTSFARLDALNAAKGYTSSAFTGFTRTDGKASDAPTASTVNVTISSPLYNSSYTYDKATNTYIRSQAGAPHVDRESGQIAPSVVIAMRVDETTVFEDGYRQSIQAVGSGEATIFQNGTATTVTWSKPSRTSQITFTAADGKDVPLVRGQTWISAVPNGSGDVSWQ
jgi:Protein of unknown function (DUF3048) N-terminal domain/Protein of unknown function (DUF3048) C-terminal domain